MVLEKTLEHPSESKDIKPVTPKRNQSWILIGRTDAEAEAPVFWPPEKKKSWLIEKTLMLGKIEGRRREQQRMRWLNVITNSMGMSFSKLQEIVKGRAAWWALVHGVTKSQTQCSNWTIIMLDRTSLTLAAMLVAPFWGDLRFSWGGQILKHSCLTGIG